MLVLLGEVGGIEEYKVIEAVKSGQIKKPIVAWAIGTCAKMFATEVQFGHAGSMANSDLETAEAKNNAMKAAGFLVPDTFEDLPVILKNEYERLLNSGVISPKTERSPPNIPIDYKWAQELGLVRKPAQFISTISDERGQELLYNGMRISDVFKEDVSAAVVMCDDSTHLETHRSVLEVLWVFSGSRGGCQHTRPSSWKWSSCLQPITVQLFPAP